MSDPILDYAPDELAAILAEPDTTRRRAMCVGFTLTQGPKLVARVAALTEALRACADAWDRLYIQDPSARPAFDAARAVLGGTGTP